MDEKIINVEQGKYAIDVKTLKKTADEPSAMANYLSQSAIVTKEGEVLTLSLLFQSEQTITGFQIKNSNGEYMEASDRQVDEETERRFELFVIDELSTILHARVQYEIEHEGRSFHGDETLRLSFDEGSLEKLT